MRNGVLSLLGLIVLLVLMMIRIPVGFAMAMVGFAGVAIVKGPGAAMGVLKNVPHSTVASYGMSVVPLFIFMGELAFHGGMTTTLYAGAYKLLGRLRGDLSMATIAASGVDGGLIVSPRSSIDEATPENLMAMVDFTREFGVYV